MPYFAYRCVNCGEEFDDVFPDWKPYTTHECKGYYGEAIAYWKIEMPNVQSIYAGPHTDVHEKKNIQHGFYVPNLEKSPGQPAWFTDRSDYKKWLKENKYKEG